MAKIIAVHNQKGGVGKTTTTTNVGFELARKGYKVLLADLDPQATLTSALGVTDPEETVFSALQGAVDGKETRLPWIRLQENISLCPSCRKMADAEYLLQNEYGRENFLKELAARTDGGYDFVLLDCPPAVGLITVNALVAATDLIIPGAAGSGFFIWSGFHPGYGCCNTEEDQQGTEPARYAGDTV